MKKKKYIAGLAAPFLCLIIYLNFGILALRAWTFPCLAS